MATTNAFCLASPPLARICLHGDLQRFGRRLSLYVNTAAEAIRALSLQVPGFRTVRTFTWTIWRSPAFTGCPCPLHRRAISCCAALAHRWPIMPPFTAATVNCFTICLNN
nr:tail assembly protein [Escherichia coli]